MNKKFTSIQTVCGEFFLYWQKTERYLSNKINSMVVGDQVIYGPMWTAQHDIRDWVINQKLQAIRNYVSIDIKGLP